MKKNYFKNIQFTLFVFLALFAGTSGSFGQLYLNAFTGASACPTNGNVPTVALNATGTPASRSTITCNATANVFNSTTLNNTAAISNTSYLEFSVTADAGFRLDLTSLSFLRQGSNTAPNQIEVRYSTDGFASSVTWGAAPLTPTAGTVATWDFTDFSSPAAGTVTFRIYPYGTQRCDLGIPAAASTGTFRVDDVTINGTVVAVCTGTPTGGTSTPALASFCSSGSTTISATGFTSPIPGLTYQWQSSSDLAFTTPVNEGAATSTYSDLTTPTITATTYYRLRVDCSTGPTVGFSSIATVTITTAANSAALAPAGTTTMSAANICEDGIWTYYKNPTNPAQVLFGVRWGTDPLNLIAKAAATISLTNDASFFSAEDPTFGTGKATYTMKRYWNIDLAGNPLGVPVDVRFFYDAAEKTAVDAAAGTFASTYVVGVEPASWFKTSSGPFVPSVTSVIPDFVVTSTALTDANAVPAATLNGVLYAQFNGLSSFSGGTYATGASPGGSGSVLPVKVEYFRGTKQASSHVLDWKVSCTNTQYAKMTVELNTDGRNFSSIYSIKETAVRCQQPFSFTNINPVAGISYYRLRMEDDYGVVSYSSIVALMNGIKGFELVNIAPNPVTEGRFKLNITSAEQKKMEVYITDVTGKIVQKQTVNIIPGFNTVEMNVSKLAGGTYQLFGITTEGKTRVLQFFKP